VATETLLADFLREIRDVSIVRRRNEDQAKTKKDKEQSEPIRRLDAEKLPDITLSHPERAAFLQEDDAALSDTEEQAGLRDEIKAEADHRDNGGEGGRLHTSFLTDICSVWIPGQGVRVDYPAIVEILLLQLDNQRACSVLSVYYDLFNTSLPVDDEIQQSTALRWLADFLNFAHEVMVPFTPRLIPAILPNLAHHVTMIQSAAIRTNKLLLNVIQNLPSPTDASSRPATDKQPAVSRNIAASPTPTATSSNPSRQSTAGKESGVSTRGDVSSPEDLTDTPTPPSVTMPNAPLSQKSRGSTMQSSLSDMGPPPPPSGPSRPQSPLSGISALAAPQPSMPPPPEDYRLFDYQATVNELTIQFLSEHEDTRVAALKWLIMLHQKAPKDVSFPIIASALSYIMQRSSLWMMAHFPRYSKHCPILRRRCVC
jgi:vacuole morphology and inheritance protein 14